MSTPLTDSINALTTYANEITGKEDTNLSDAVHTLANGYGSGDDYMAQNLMDTLKTYSSDEVTSVRNHAFRGSNIERVTLPNCTSVGQYILRECTKLKTIYASDFPKLELINASAFLGVTNLECAVFKSATQFKSACVQNSIFKTLDVGGADIIPLMIEGSAFVSCDAMDTMILRYSAVIPLILTAFRSTPFDNGGSGGTIYVPSALISAYKAAQNWSTLNGYGTVTWTSIEGSIYEHQYADGTPIE